MNGVLTIPPEFSRRVLAHNEPKVALIEDNTDSFVSTALAGMLGGMLTYVAFHQLGLPLLVSALLAGARIVIPGIARIIARSSTS